MKPINWKAIYTNYKGLWVALDEDNETVVGSGQSPEQALDEAHIKGFSNAALTYVPEEVINFAGAHQHEAAIY
jgi:hypothetical protein